MIYKRVLGHEELIGGLVSLKTIGKGKGWIDE